jgi:hypothetical protein
MGQYYNVVIKNKNTIITYNKKVDGKYTMPKLTENIRGGIIHLFLQLQNCYIKIPVKWRG